MVPLFLDVLRVLDNELVLLNLKLVSFLSKVECFLLGITQPSFAVIEVPPHGPDDFSFLGGVLNPELQCMVVRDQLADLLLVPLLDL